MKFVRYVTDESPQWAIERDAHVSPLSGRPGGAPDLRDLANPVVGAEGGG